MPTYKKKAGLKSFKVESGAEDEEMMFQAKKKNFNKRLYNIDKSKIFIVCTECENKVEIELDLEEIKIDTHKDHTDLIKLTDDIQVRMVPPKMEYLMATVSKNQIDIVMDVIRDSISEIIQGKEVFSAQDHTREELEEFLNSLNSGQFQNVRHFFETMPALRHDIEYTCNKCNKTEKQTLQGLASFFASA